jgi:hypothetical protein
MIDKKNKLGRPLLFNSPEELQEKITAYYKSVDENPIKKQEIHGKDCEVCIIEIPRPYTIEGLAEFLDCDRQTLLNYSEKENFFGTIQRAKDRIFKQKSELAIGGIYNVNAFKFDAINNHNRIDKQNIEESGEKTVNIKLTNYNYNDLQC